MAWLDIDYPRTVLVGLLVVLNLGIAGAVTTSDAPYGPYNSDWDGTSSLRQTAGAEAPLDLAHTTAAYEDAQPNGTVAFVVAPQRQYDPTDRARLRQFVSRGGTLVVASDDTRTNDLLADLGVGSRIDGTLVRDEEENYRNASLPAATNVSTHPLTDGVDSLTLNYGTVLDVSFVQNQTTRRPTYLVNTSGFSYLDTNRNGELDDSERLRARPVAVAEQVGDGRVVVVSDGSVFTNAMLDRSGNAQFVRTLASTHERVLVDHSHGYPLPPLVYGLLVVRSTPLLQLGLGLVAIGGVAVWTRRPDISVPDWGRGDRPADPGPESLRDLEEADLTAYLAAEHPEWDDERVERVTKAIRRSGDQADTNE